MNESIDQSMQVFDSLGRIELADFFEGFVKGIVCKNSEADNYEGTDV
jgi:hypothetical protein